MICSAVVYSLTYFNAAFTPDAMRVWSRANISIICDIRANICHFISFSSWHTMTGRPTTATERGSQRSLANASTRHANTSLEFKYWICVFSRRATRTISKFASMHVILSRYKIASGVNAPQGLLIDRLWYKGYVSLFFFSSRGRWETMRKASVGDYSIVFQT